MPKPLSDSARERLAARARRIATIRRRVLVGTLSTFVLAWGVIAFDGSMGATTASTQDPTSPPASQDTGSSSSFSDGTSSSDSSSSSSGDSFGAVTTSQS